MKTQKQPSIIRPVRTKRDHKNALARVDALLSATKNSSERDELEVLITLVDAYENAREPMEPPTPIEAIRFRMDQMGMNRKDVEELIGISRARLSEILTKKRALSIGMIRSFQQKMGLPAEILIRDYALRKGVAKGGVGVGKPRT